MSTVRHCPAWSGAAALLLAGLALGGRTQADPLPADAAPIPDDAAPVPLDLEPAEPTPALPAPAEAPPPAPAEAPPPAPLAPAPPPPATAPPPGQGWEETVARMRTRGFGEADIRGAYVAAGQGRRPAPDLVEKLAGFRYLGLPESEVPAFLESELSLTDYYNARIGGSGQRGTGIGLLCGGLALAGLGASTDHGSSGAGAVVGGLIMVAGLAIATPGVVLLAVGSSKIARWAPERLLDDGTTGDLQRYAERDDLPPPTRPAPSATAPPPAPGGAGPGDQASVERQLAAAATAQLGAEQQVAAARLRARGFSDDEIRQAIADAAALGVSGAQPIERLAAYRLVGLPLAEMLDFLRSELSVTDTYNRRLGGKGLIVGGINLLAGGLTIAAYYGLGLSGSSSDSSGADSSAGAGVAVGAVAALVGPVLILTGKSKTDRWAPERLLDEGSAADLRHYALPPEEVTPPATAAGPAAPTAMLLPLLPPDGGAGLQLVLPF